MTDLLPDDPHDKETGRIEAFSDGVIAIAITILALELRVPQPSDNANFSLIQELIKQWPTYFAFFLSFLFVLVMWINHHRLFTVIRRSDNNLMILNGLLLMGIMLVPFGTDLVATYLLRPEQNIAVMVYGGIFFVVSIFFNVLWRYASYKGRLFNKKTDMALAQFITRQYIFGPVFYFVVLVLAAYSTAASLLISLLLAVFFALPNKAVQKLIDESQDGAG